MKLIITESQLKRLMIETKLIDNGSYIINKGNDKSNDFTIIYGGIPSSKYGSNFLKNELIDLLSDKNIVFSNFENDINFLTKKLKDVYPNSKVKGIVGFSRGGLNSYDLIGKYNFIGLIDPSLPKEIDINKDYNNVYMIYNPKNWGEKYRHIIDSQKKLSKILGDKSKLIEINHSNMVKKFIEIFKNYL
jgi:hypothetical protein